MPRVMSLLLFVIALEGCFVPSYYQVSFPPGVEEEIPTDLLEGSRQLLVIPCWWWIKDSRYGFGPPVVLPAEALERLPEEIAAWRGFEVIDVLDHEGGDAPTIWGVLLISDDGVALRIENRYASPRVLGEDGRWFWGNGVVAAIGPGLRADLQRALSDRPLDEEATVDLFGHKSGEVLGTPQDLETALAFLQKIHADGDDLWHAF